MFFLLHKLLCLLSLASILPAVKKILKKMFSIRFPFSCCFVFRFSENICFIRLRRKGGKERIVNTLLSTMCSIANLRHRRHWIACSGMFQSQSLRGNSGNVVCSESRLYWDSVGYFQVRWLITNFRHGTWNPIMEATWLLERKEKADIEVDASKLFSGNWQRAKHVAE